MPRLLQSLFISASLVVSPFALYSPLVQAADTTAAKPSATFSQQEIEQLVAPIALYPDSLFAQVLMASTYPLEVVQAARWRKANPSLKDKALEDALQKQTWDASVKSLTVFPDVLTMMNDKLDWTQKLGDAVLAQQKDLMDASQRLRQKAQAEGNLKSSKEQKVIVETEPTTVIKIEPATEVVYVPVYNPTVVYGPWPYPYYTPYYWYPPGYAYGAAMFGFTTGIIFGAAFWGNCNWGGGDINIDVDRFNNFNRVDHRNTNINNGKWQHNPEHRRGVEYRDQGTRDQFRPNDKMGNQQRDAFRGKADASREDLKNVDRNQLQQQLKDVDRNALQEREKIQNGNNPVGRDVPNKPERPAATDRAGQTDRGQSAQQRDFNNRASQNNAFSNADRAQVNRAASERGMSSQRSSSFQRPPRSGGRR